MGTGAKTKRAGGGIVMEHPSTETMWKAVLCSDRSCDGNFFYAVRSTGIVCRPSCPSRKPRRDNTVFFRELEEALVKGFRPCKRCRPDLGPGFDPRAEIAEEAERILRTRFGEPGILQILPNLTGLTRMHLDRVFKSVLGLTTSTFLSALRVEKARELMVAAPDAETADVALSVGFRTLSCFYAAFREISGQPPRLFRGSLSPGMKDFLPVAYDLVPAGAWTLTVAVREGKLCKVAVDENDWNSFSAGLPCKPDPGACAVAAGQLAEDLRGERKNFSIPLENRGTPFDLGVREAVASIPYGQTRSYGEIAAAMGVPRAARAIGQANSRNPLPLVIPCHRVIGGDGRLVGYKGSNTGFKRFLLDLEKENLDGGGESKP
jgi:AraC family transcriptional regulator of adaptative response/methylated-DNA-[protein]-cysteine methyltransferase